MFGQKSHSFCVSFTCVNTGPISTTAFLVQRMRQVSSRKRPFVASVIWILCTFILFWGKLLLNNGYPAFYQLQLILLCWNGFSLIKKHSRRCWWTLRVRAVDEVVSSTSNTLKPHGCHNPFGIASPRREEVTLQQFLVSVSATFS